MDIHSQRCNLTSIVVLTQNKFRARQSVTTIRIYGFDNEHWRMAGKLNFTCEGNRVQYRLLFENTDLGRRLQQDFAAYNRDNTITCVENVLAGISNLGYMTHNQKNIRIDFVADDTLYLAGSVLIDLRDYVFYGREGRNCTQAFKDFLEGKVALRQEYQSNDEPGGLVLKGVYT